MYILILPIATNTNVTLKNWHSILKEIITDFTPINHEIIKKCKDDFNFRFFN